ncbi:integral membrane [Fusarium albosuccineum]|uniref:Integral membrane n=1 Tax=Fusarium albosuccineum TaxID=1237068 RepID=A0A8H4LMP8_9HYPO|nr:integral membrane [Fusarium albosuccineum]
MRLSSVSLLLGGLTALVHAAGFADLAAQLPACGLECVQSAIPNSPCELTNSTCLCTDQTFAGLTQQCVAKSCTVKESLTMLRLQNLACGVPVKSQQVRFKIHAIAACIIAEICVIMRLFSKIHILGKLGPEDYLIIVAGLATVPYLYCHCTLADLGFGLNIWDVVPFANLYQLLKIFWIDQMLYSVHLYSTKLSILCFLAGIFPSRSFKNVTIGLAIFVALSGAATLITTGLQCLPASYNYSSWDGESKGHCNDLNSQTYAFGGINMACDLAIVVMPLHELYRLQVSGRQKIQLFVIFSLGIIVTVFSIIRLPFLVTLGKTTNPTWDYVEVTIWSIWETELGMVCASLPAIRHLFKHMFPNALSTIVAKMTSATGSKGTGYDQSGSWAPSRSRGNGSKADKKDYYELDERSLIGRGPEGANPNASRTNIETSHS